jgi:hypothetical protein
MGISPLGLQFFLFEQIDPGIGRIDLDQRPMSRILRLFVAVERGGRGRLTQDQRPNTWVPGH